VSDSSVWNVVSTYQDGTRIVELQKTSKELAEYEAKAIREFRARQDEAPVVTVEPAP
jgi:hypothetical protein